MSIGRFARRAGLSIGALRHYAEIGLLRPARVDPDTGYRYYAEEQLDTARLIARLRDVDVPLALIREVRDAPPDVLRKRLARHGADLDAALWRLQRTAHRLRQFIDNEEIVMPVPPFTLDPDDVGCGHEAIARAHWVAGARDGAARHLDLGYAVLDKITDREERELLNSDLDSVAGPREA